MNRVERGRVPCRLRESGHENAIEEGAHGTPTSAAQFNCYGCSGYNSIAISVAASALEHRLNADCCDPRSIRPKVDSAEDATSPCRRLSIALADVLQVALRTPATCSAETRMEVRWRSQSIAESSPASETAQYAAKFLESLRCSAPRRAAAAAFMTMLQVPRGRFAKGRQVT